MNKQLQKMKDALTAYKVKAQEAEQKIARAKELYQEEPAKAEEKRIRDALAKDRQAAIAAIKAAKEEAAEGIKEWATKEGSKITDDSKLLAAGLINPDEYRGLVEKYADNYTMLDMLRQYGIKRNAEAAQDHKGVPADPFPAHMIPTAEEKYNRWDNAEKSAVDLLKSMSEEAAPGSLMRSPEFAALALERWGENVEM